MDSVVLVMLKPSLPETQVSPAPELEKRTRRRFSTEYKLRIIAKADVCQYGELGAILRGEGDAKQPAASDIAQTLPAAQSPVGEVAWKSPPDAIQRRIPRPAAV
jgi:hypothetical protein